MLGESARLWAQPPNPPSHTKAELYGFVLRTYIHGLDEYKALEYSGVPDSVGALREIRESPELKDYWQNAIIMHGLLGQTEVYGELKAFLEEELSARGGKPLTTLSPSLFRAKLSVLRALGFLANQTPDQNVRTEIVSYLEDGARPGSWSSRGLVWKSPYDQDRTDNRRRNMQLSEKAIIALGLSGTDISLNFLRSLRTSLEGGRAAPGPGTGIHIDFWAQEVLTPAEANSLLSATTEAFETNLALHHESLKSYLLHNR
jgi:hypothetical protein